MRQAGRPVGPFSEDSFVDYCVTEAVILSEMHADRTASKAQRREEIMARWKSDQIDTDEAQRLLNQLDG